MRRRVLIGLAALVALAAASRAALTAVHTYRYERATFSAPREVPVRPSWPGLRDVAFGEGIAGWYAPPANGAVIVYVHGAPSNRAEHVALARALADKGFGALLFDLPGCGESRGPIDWGAPSRAAISAAVSYALAQPGVRRLGAFGFSRGSAILAVEAADDPRVQALALAGVFPDARSALDEEFSRWGLLTQLPARWAAVSGGLRLEERQPIDGVARISPRPLLFIGGTRDITVPLESTRRLFEAAREPKRLWVVQGARHGDYAGVLGGAYYDGVAAFFQEGLR